MDWNSELVFIDGLPNGVRHRVTDQELLQMEDRLDIVPLTAEPSSASSVEQPSSSSIYQPSSDDTRFHKTEGPALDYERGAVGYWKSGKRKRLSLGSVRGRFPLVKSIRTLRRWAAQINPKSRSEKLRNIFNKTLEVYNEVR